MFDHRDLDPRPKLAFVVVVSVVAIATPRAWPLTVVSAAVVGLVALGRGLGVREWLGFLASLRVLVPAIFVLNLLFYGGGEVFLRLPVLPLAITVGGLEASGLIVARLLVIAGVAAWFARTTEAEAFEVALVGVGVPWSLAFVGSLTLRLVPEMRARYRMVEDAQRARGARFGGGPLRRARARIPVFIPFFVAVIQYGYELTDALVVRDFGASPDRTSIVVLEHRGADYALYAASAVLLVGVIAASTG